jgi:DNA replication ATP-dependent helicase Dna2
VQAIQRYLVINISKTEYEDANGRACKEQVLLLSVEGTKSTRFVHLRGFWYLSPVTEKAYVHVIGTFIGNRCTIDNSNNMLILHPDHLVSSTVVADSFSCTRRAVLQDRVKATGDAAPPMVYGTILHEIFQTALVANRWDTEYLGEIIEDIATKHVEELYTIKIQVEDAIEYLISKMGELQSWAELFVSSQPKPEAVVHDRHSKKASMCVSKLLDVEEHVWSPMYGLKGNIDATVQVTMQDGNERRTLTVPFEVKTGKNPSASHRAQTALYNLLISDRYDMEVAFGILYYMETSETIRIPKFRSELIHMIMKRNELACFVRERHAELPEMERKESLCGRCYAKVPCFIYHRLADNGTGETSGLGTKFNDIVKHLTPKHKDFFLKWDNLLTKEEKESMKFRRELWTMLSSEREKLGRCFSSVVIEPGSAFEDVSNPKINRFSYTFTKQKHLSGFSFLESQIIVGEPIVVSDEKGHFALANGYVTKVGKRRITVAVDRRLHNARIRLSEFNDIDNQVFTSIMQVGMSPTELLAAKPEEQPVLYRLDKDEFSNGMATVRNNLIQVMVDGPMGSRQIRGLVVDLNAPRFKTQSTAYVLKDRESINVDQKRAIEKVMSAQDYALVLGMPGTGKTTTIAHIIRALVSQGKSVLLTSYTHTAVDNILLKLQDEKVLRLGNVAKVHPEVKEFATLAATTKATFDEVKSAWHDSPIVATTCLGINHAIFKERTFDYCIVDEASQITLPVCLGPICLSKTFILVGDHNQLPPLVQNEEARLGGLDISLFKHLSDTHPSSVVYLEHQYRMCKDVMSLSNNLIYQGRLKCGSKEVAERQITVPNMDGLRIHHFSPSTISRSQKSICTGPSRGRCWIRDMMDPSLKVAFLNTDTLSPDALEEAKGNRIVNPTEATICSQLVESLISVGVDASEIGVMTHYRSQLALLKHSLRQHSNVEMHTADRFQGRDKEVIILSLVRSNSAHSIGELLKDWRRINVAFTRAKTKLLVVGSRETLKGNGKDKDGKEEMIAEFIKLLESKKWIYNLPKTALGDHYFDDFGTQASATATTSRGTQFKILEDVLEDDTSKLKPNRPLMDVWDKENQIMKVQRRMPKKVHVGQKPFKIPKMSVLTDIYNEALG